MQAWVLGYVSGAVMVDYSNTGLPMLPMEIVQVPAHFARVRVEEPVLEAARMRAAADRFSMRIEEQEFHAVQPASFPEPSFARNPSGIETPHDGARPSARRCY